jgi:hypothetical protein
MDGNTELGAVELQSGKAVLTTTALHPGSNRIKVEYNPATGFRASAATVVEDVRKPRSKPKVILQSEAFVQATAAPDSLAAASPLPFPAPLPPRKASAGL